MQPSEITEVLNRPTSQELLVPSFLDVLTNPDEVAVPAEPTVEQGWGFAVAKMKEFVRSHRDDGTAD